LTDFLLSFYTKFYTALLGAALYRLEEAYDESEWIDAASVSTPPSYRRISG